MPEFSKSEIGNDTARRHANAAWRRLRNDPDYRTPTVSLLCKLGSIARHADEATGPAAHPADFQAIRGLLDDPEVSEWMTQLDAQALLPVKR